MDTAKKPYLKKEKLREENRGKSSFCVTSCWVRCPPVTGLQLKTLSALKNLSTANSHETESKCFRRILEQPSLTKSIIPVDRARLAFSRTAFYKLELHCGAGLAQGRITVPEQEPVKTGVPDEAGREQGLIIPSPNMVSSEITLCLTPFKDTSLESNPPVTLRRAHLATTFRTRCPRCW